MAGRLGYAIATIILLYALISVLFLGLGLFFIVSIDSLLAPLTNENQGTFTNFIIMWLILPGWLMAIVVLLAAIRATAAEIAKR